MTRNLAQSVARTLSPSCCDVPRHSAARGRAPTLLYIAELCRTYYWVHCKSGQKGNLAVLCKNRLSSMQRLCWSLLLWIDDGYCMVLHGITVQCLSPLSLASSPLGNLVVTTCRYKLLERFHLAFLFGLCNLNPRNDFDKLAAFLDFVETHASMEFQIGLWGQRHISAAWMSTSFCSSSVSTVQALGRTGDSRWIGMVCRKRNPKSENCESPSGIVGGEPDFHAFIQITQFHILSIISLL